MNRLKEVKAQILQNPEASAEYETQKPEFAIARQLNKDLKLADVIAAKPLPHLKPIKTAS